MKLQQYISLLNEFDPNLEVENWTASGHRLVPEKQVRRGETLCLHFKPIVTGYKVKKKITDGVEASPLQEVTMKTREQAAAEITYNIYDEIGWTHPDLLNKFTEVMGDVVLTNDVDHYSFANCEWWIEEVWS